MLNVLVIDQKGNPVSGVKIRVDYYGSGVLGPIIGWMGGNGSAEGTTDISGVCALSVSTLAATANITATKGISYAEGTCGLEFGNGECKITMTINVGEVVGNGFADIMDFLKSMFMPIILLAVIGGIAWFVMKSRSARGFITGLPGKAKAILGGI
jgi:hypothetical protein